MTDEEIRKECEKRELQLFREIRNIIRMEDMRIAGYSCIQDIRKMMDKRLTEISKWADENEELSDE